MSGEPFGNLKYIGIEIEPCPQNPDEACLFVRFMDEDTGKLWEWMPAWKPVRELFEKSSNVEVLNFPKSEYTSDFAKVSKRVFDKITRNIQGAELIQGVMQEVDGNKIVIESEENSYLLPIGFDISSEKFLWDWLDREIEGLVVNEILVEMRTDTGLSYPPNISDVKRDKREIIKI
ncbi:hypothetical protein AKJ41_04705 [candidate division MSBL1 archaeon SCGC-AAA259O05]|uniref:Uncharacterized protein n=1 Tax=candidate division MSBL1 archaeon SCGC-AAA259O05 TaxID=1698271 RepID=A0A133V0E8_9EURY|nr:hypothetical protein AKJ41_04705 [candidate division MSBL1 archaeon SCGC-AAA259O05]